MEHKKIVIVGAGPAGMMAAIRTGQLHQDVTLIEKNSILGRKLLLSGKGRCNLTNTCDLDSFIDKFSESGKNGQFLRDAFKKFFYPELMNFFQERGLKLKVERQLRVFPETDKSINILQVLEQELIKNQVKVITQAVLKDILIEGGKVSGILLEDKSKVFADKVILAIGGISYSFTGSSGEGLKIAQKTGHSIVPLRPGLVPLLVKEKYPKALEGLTLKNIRLRFSDSKKEIISDIGELVFTGAGISGPLVLSLSGKVVDWLKTEKNVFVEIDLKPALSPEQLDARLLREFSFNPKKGIRNVLKELLPLRMISLFMEIIEINPFKKANQINQAERLAMVNLLKSFRMQITASLPIEEAMITKGGVSLKDINPRTMESLRVKGLYFCGEMIDVDADTGGFNLQAAFSTGYLAGESAAS